MAKFWAEGASSETTLIYGFGTARSLGQHRRIEIRGKHAESRKLLAIRKHCLVRASSGLSVLHESQHVPTRSAGVPLQCGQYPLHSVPQKNAKFAATEEGSHRRSNIHKLTTALNATGM